MMKMEKIKGWLSQNRVAVLMMVVILWVAITSFLLLANKPTPPIRQDVTKEVVAILVKQYARQDSIARRKEGLLLAQIDSMKQIINQNYKHSDEKIRTDIDLYTDQQLDSVLTNYRYRTLAEERSRRRSEGRGNL